MVRDRGGNGEGVAHNQVDFNRQDQTNLYGSVLVFLLFWPCRFWPKHNFGGQEPRTHTCWSPFHDSQWLLGKLVSFFSSAARSQLEVSLWEIL